MRALRPAIVLIAVFTVLTGLIFPIAFSGVATTVVPGVANGSIIERDGKPIGSALIGQNFTSDRYFHPRPSATLDTDPNDSTKTIPSPYNADNSAGSNLAPSSKALIDRVTGDVKAIGSTTPVPGDMVTTSASGLDPDISPDNAMLQVARVAKARGLPEDRVRALVDEHVTGRLFGLFGQPRVNVLSLNLALDQLKVS
ncbi:MAG TPA: potassium-transporting ATPase subunit KdpC [Acetobacteraceae bacterium]|jgi:K+-transporting ATPase ATPase C chain|nr:potassium-transporting ATPase subunit KdpC [Acetobacteraceae bacterium]